MVYRYFKPSPLSKFNQRKVFERLKHATPDGTNIRVDTEAIVRLASERNLFAAWGRLSPDSSTLSQQVKFFLEKSLPLIACQQWHKSPRLGHFRVIVGAENDEILFHDPEIGTANSRLPLEKFIEQWRLSEGGNVTRGAAIRISKEPLEATPLGPDQPNPGLSSFA
jgi:hypothetical protein